MMLASHLVRVRGRVRVRVRVRIRARIGVRVRGAGVAQVLEVVGPAGRAEHQVPVGPAHLSRFARWLIRWLARWLGK